MGRAGFYLIIMVGRASSSIQIKGEFN